MDDQEPPEKRHRLRRTIVLATVCLGASFLGMILAHPIAAHLRWSAPWVLPAIAVGVLVALVLVTLLVLPRIASRRG
ncbi:MAG TPA: hypothetical protein VMF03_13750 [Steroidobacteraceae bacterium]|nr:hypothetical protein [Steroidobacteraceae bacterium]